VKMNYRSVNEALPNFVTFLNNALKFNTFFYRIVEKRKSNIYGEQIILLLFE